MAPAVVPGSEPAARDIPIRSEVTDFVTEFTRWISWEVHPFS